MGEGTRFNYTVSIKDGDVLIREVRKK